MALAGRRFLSEAAPATRQKALFVNVISGRPARDNVGAIWAMVNCFRAFGRVDASRSMRQQCQRKNLR